MRWVTREYARTVRAKRRSAWHRWFAWYPVVVRFDKEFERRVWLERLERKWSVGRYGDQKGHWRYRHPVFHPEQHDLDSDGPELVPPAHSGDEARPGENSRLH
jgi:hypothetical protein